MAFQFLMVVAEGEVLKIFGQDRIQLLHPRTRLGLHGFFALFAGGKKCEVGPDSMSELSADFTSWTPAACGVPMVPEPVLEAEFEEEDLDKWVDEFGRWWSRSEV